MDQQDPPQKARVVLPRDSGTANERKAGEWDVQGDLLTTVRFADVQWWPGDWTKALLIFERCLIYSAGHTRTFLAWSGIDALANETDPGLPPQYDASTRYDASLAAIGSLDVEQIVAEHQGSWVVWSSDVTDWDLRKGLAASRLQLRLADSTRRKVLWGRMSNSFPVIRRALERAMDTAPGH